MPFCEGETLKRKIAEGPLPVGETVEITRQIADGLQAAHEAGITHQDVKPANTFVPAARSLIMDVETFDAFRASAGKGTPSDVETLPHLTRVEQAVFQSLAQPRLRLAQERISQAHVEQTIARISCCEG